MSLSGRNAPLSPVSIGGSEWSFSPKILSAEEVRHYPNYRGTLVSPPHSGESNGNMSINGFSPGSRSNGGPSPPPSVGRSSNGTNTYSGRSDGNRSSTRAELDETVLHEHYLTLKAFLTARDPHARQQSSKARDKLLRLSSVQFYELSTDVYDELMRRQASVRTRPNSPNAPPAFLLPEKNFHPKRNQARQRLSSLGSSRFRDLAADVFHELERRYPAFVGADVPRTGSAMSMRLGPASRAATPVNGNAFPPRGHSRVRRPSENGSPRGGQAAADGYPVPPSPGLPNGEYGRPMPKQLNQNNTIVPNKSTMLEEDDGNGADEDGADVFSLERVATRGGSKRSGESGGTSEADKKLIEEYQSQVRELREKLEGMEDTVKRKEDSMKSLLDTERSRLSAANQERRELSDLRSVLEKKLSDAQSLNKSMKQELDRVREDHMQETRQLREQLSTTQSQNSRAGSFAGQGNSDLGRENDDLRESLRQQQQVTEDVRREAEEFLREMRMLSQQSSSAYEKQADLERTIERLEGEVREWRSRYARAKTQLRNMRASSLGLAAEEDAASYVRDRGFLDEDGLVKDVHVTKYQMAIDELLQTARKERPDRVIDAMKSVVVGVRRITRDVDSATMEDAELAQERARLKAKVSVNANSLITASKNFVGGAGISPVCLLDAAASHLTAAVVNLLREVKIRTTPTGELEDGDETGSATPIDSTGLFSPGNMTQASGHERFASIGRSNGFGGVRASAESSAYSAASSRRESAATYASGVPNGVKNRVAYLESDDGPSAGSSGYGIQHGMNPANDFRSQGMWGSREGGI